jgi:hypothetical protein
MLAIGGAAGAASFTHVHNVAAAHGQGGWLSWADAVVLELMSIASGLEMRRRKRQSKSVYFPAAVLGCAVALSISAQVVEAELSVIGWIAAALPALGFLAMVKVALGRTASSAPVKRPADLPTTPETLTNSPVRGDATFLVDHTGAADSAAVAELPQAETSLAEDSVKTRTERSRRAEGASVIGPSELADVAHLLPAARAVQEALREHGWPLTHKALTVRLRADGHTVSNARAATLVRVLKGATGSEEQDTEVRAISIDREVIESELAA